MLRVGVVPIKDSTGQSLPTDSLQLDLLSEFGRNKIDTVVLTTDTPLKDVESEAREKQCDYFVYTVPTVLKDPNTGGLSPASLPKGVKLDPANYQALTLITLYKVGKPVPELKDRRSPPMQISSGLTRFRPRSFRSPTKSHSRLRTTRIRKRLRSQRDQRPSREQPQPKSNNDENVGDMSRRQPA